jgi:hypothetical protein
LNCLNYCKLWEIQYCGNYEINPLIYLSNETHFLGLFSGESLLLLGLDVLGLLTHDTATPGSPDIDVIIVLRSEVLGESLELGLVLLLDSGEGNNSAVLLTNQGSETSLGLENAEWNILLPAESGEPDNELNWINIMSNDNQLGLLILNGGSDLMETINQRNRLSLSGLLTGGLGLGDLLQTLLLLLLGLRSVLLKKLEELTGLVLVQSVAELVDHWRNLQSLQENLLLSLKVDVLRPLHISREISLRLDILTDTEVLLNHLINPS